MDNGTYQGSYALITSDILQNTFSTLSQSQNGLGLQTFAYFSGIPWEDSPSTGRNPKVSDAIVLSYVSYNNQFTVDTVSYYNALNQGMNRGRTFNGYHPVGNQNIGINVGGDTYLPLNFPIFMYEYGWTSGGSGPGSSSGYYVGILQYNNTQGLGYFLTTQYTNNPNQNPNGYYDYYYSGSAYGGSDYYFLENIPRNIQGQNGGSNYSAFMPPDQQGNSFYYQYGVFWLYNWFQQDNNMNIFFLMNGNIFNYFLASVPYKFNGYKAYAIPPAPPGNIINGEPIFAQSYINAYNTAFNQQNNNQAALYEYQPFTWGNVNDNNFIPGTFGYDEEYNDQSNLNSITIGYLQDDENYYDENPYLFISAGSGGGSGFMYLDWVIVTYGVPYVASVS